MHSRFSLLKQYYSDVTLCLIILIHLHFGNVLRHNVLVVYYVKYVYIYMYIAYIYCSSTL